MNYQPILELTRGKTLESVHFGAFAVVDSRGKLLASRGDSGTVTFLRSSAKPFQALPFIESGGAEFWGYTEAEIAITCASHSGTDLHRDTVAGIQAKVGLSESQLQCGVHPPIDEATRNALIRAGETPTPNRHNCSGKHTGMLAFAKMRNLSLEDYLDPQHPIQQEIRRTLGEMCGLAPEGIALGTDGCSAPNFALPLRNAALGFARLVDPWELAPSRAAACRKITAAMTAHPEMVAGAGRFDTRLMEVAQGKIVAKGGAEGYQAVGILPGVLAPDSPGVGIALKISDGDPKSRARPAVVLGLLIQLGALTPEEAESLKEYGPVFPIYNWRKILVGEGRVV